MGRYMLRNGWSELELNINRSSNVSIYRQIEEQLREQIRTGALPVGTRLPPERRLATSLAVNRSAIAYAYRDLVAAGLVEQRVGLGPRVAPLKPGAAPGTIDAPTTDALLGWYARFGRTELPWRQTRDPYAVVVAEFMLQQTQVDRVLPLYRAFLERFPSFDALAASNAGDVMRAWRGLGYNSRAQRLRALAQTVATTYGGVMPRERAAVLALPGIGPYTAAAVRAFAFDETDAALDTNIRRIVQRLAFGLEYPRDAGGRAVEGAARTAIPAGRGHDWNSAMMDLGATICTALRPKCLLCPLQASCAAAPIDPARLTKLAKMYRKRSRQEALPFERTTRFVRGRIVDRLRDLAPNEAISAADLEQALAPIVPRDRVAMVPAVVAALVREGIVFESPLGLQLESGVH